MLYTNKKGADFKMGIHCKHSIQAVLNIIRGSANFAQKNSNYVQSKRNKQV